MSSGNRLSRAKDGEQLMGELSITKTISVRLEVKDGQKKGEQ